MAQPSFIPNPAIRGREDSYADIDVSVDAVLQSWRQSLYSYEWLMPDGRIRGPEALSASEQPKRHAVEDCLRYGRKLEKPVLGIGLMDNVEIGAGRAVLLTLAAQGNKTVPVHIPKSSIKEFEPFLA